MTGPGAAPPRLVSLPMYPLPPAVMDALSAGLAAHLREAGFEPERIAPSDLHAHWSDPALLLSQTCGYPLTHALEDRVRLVAVPSYDAPGCEGATYRSAVVVRRNETAARLEDLRGRIVAFNSPDSQSGYNALRALLAPLARNGRFFSAFIETGSHRASIAAVLEGRADVAAIDALSLALALDGAPDLPVKVLDHTAPIPALPFVTKADTSDEDVGRLRQALHLWAADPALAAAHRVSRLKGLEVLDLAAYDVIRDQERTAMALGYPLLA